MEDLPLEPARNTAGQAVLSLVQAASPAFGIELTIEKGIPLGSGLGGSAASAVAAVVAANALLDAPLAAIELLPHAIAGEAVASGARHADNIAPALFGGLVLTVGIDNPRVKQIPVPPSVRCVLLHPRMFLSTRQARGILTRLVDLSDVVWQTANLAGFLAGCYTNDLALIREAFEDVLIEPQRAKLIPGLHAREARRRRGRRARVLDLGRGAERLRLVRGGQRGGGARRRCWARSAAKGSTATTGSRRSAATARASWSAGEVHQHP